MRKILSILVALFCLTACQSTQKIMESWVGSTKSELIRSWGPPERVASDGGTGEILVYSRQGYYPGINGQGAFAFWDNRYMYVNTEGKIYYWMARRERVPPTQVNLNIYKRY